MRLLFILTFILFAGSTAIAQDFDELKKAIRKTRSPEAKAELYVQLADLLTEEEKYEDAKEQLDEALSLYEKYQQKNGETARNHWMAYYHFGFIYAQQEALDPSLQAFKKAISLCDTNYIEQDIVLLTNYTLLLYNLSYHYDLKKDTVQQIKHLRQLQHWEARLLKQDPGHWETYIENTIYLSWLERESINYLAAKRYLDICIKTIQELEFLETSERRAFNARLYSLRGELGMTIKTFKSAEEDFIRAIEDLKILVASDQSIFALTYASDLTALSDIMVINKDFERASIYNKKALFWIELLLSGGSKEELDEWYVERLEQQVFFELYSANLEKGTFYASKLKEYIFEHDLANKQLQLAKTYSLIATAYEVVDKEAAIRYYREALNFIRKVEIQTRYKIEAQLRFQLTVLFRKLDRWSDASEQIDYSIALQKENKLAKEQDLLNWTEGLISMYKQKIDLFVLDSRREKIDTVYQQIFEFLATIETQSSEDLQSLYTDIRSDYGIFLIEEVRKKEAQQVLEEVLEIMESNRQKESWSQGEYNTLSTRLAEVYSYSDQIEKAIALHQKRGRFNLQASFYYLTYTVEAWSSFYKVYTMCLSQYKETLDKIWLKQAEEANSYLDSCFQKAKNHPDFNSYSKEYWPEAIAKHQVYLTIVAELLPLKKAFNQVKDNKQYALAYKYQLGIIALWERAYSKAEEGDQRHYAAEKLATELGRLSWYALFVNQYKQAEQLARRGLALKADERWINTNLAHALLFQRKDAEAKKVYEALARPDADGDDFSSTLWDDFEELQKAGKNKQLIDMAKRWVYAVGKW